MTNDFEKTVQGMSDDELAALETSVRDAREKKRVGIDINSIKPGMTPEQVSATRAEIARILAGK